MVIQLRSALEELGRLRLREDACWPAWSSDEGLRELLDGDLRRELLDRAPGEGQKVLLLGAGWPRLAVDLARRGAFVTVVDPDVQRIVGISRAAGEAGLLGRVSVSGDDYKTRSFEPSAFNMVVAWDTLERYTEIEPLLKKIVRELKAGGRLFLRTRVVPVGTSEELRRTVRSILPLVARGDRAALARDSFLMPSHGSTRRDLLVAAVEHLFVVEQVRSHHVVAADLADLAAGVAPELRALLPKARRLDDHLLSRHPEWARFVSIMAGKEKQLGRVFRPGG